MSGAKLCDEFSAVFCGVYGEGFGDAEEGIGEGGDRELFAGSLGYVSSRYDEVDILSRMMSEKPKEAVV